MKIESVSNGNVGMPTGKTSGADAVTKNLQDQIRAKQQELQKLSENEDMDLEQKMKKRQQIQQEISSLNTELRQHQIKQRKEQQSDGTSMDDMLGEQNAQKAAQKKPDTGMSQAGMKAMISADASMKQAAVHGSVAREMEGRANVLKAEMKQDGARGASTEKKAAELADITARKEAAETSQISTLRDANDAMKEVNRTEREESDKEKEADSAKKSEERNADDADYDPVDIRL